MSAQTRILAQSTHFVLTNEYEKASAIDRRTGEHHSVGEHYGDPTCGLISPEEDWFLVGGEGLTLLDLRRGRRDFLRNSDRVAGGRPCFIRAMRLQSPGLVRVLVDPWSEEASTWLLDISALGIKKVSDGPRLVGQPMREDVPF